MSHEKRDRTAAFKRAAFKRAATMSWSNTERVHEIYTYTFFRAAHAFS